ncbi:MAG: histidinol-phosphatase HisJ family protein [Oscillospiraceae bacterium]|nr:histidinol-phosphatase HisJ family protein [Oscillospiraceae bacterium]
MYSDSHIHTRFSGDSEELPENQAEKALMLGLEGICFTDHLDHDVVSDVDFELDVPAYWEYMTALKERYRGRLDIRTGVELGLQTHLTGYFARLLDSYPFDYVIGSVHFVGGLDPYYPEYFRRYGKGAYLTYFEATYDCVSSLDCYDSLGHLDYIARYGGPYGLEYSYEKYADAIDPILRRLIEGGHALECNSGGFSRGMGGPNPVSDVLRRYRELGGELVTIGSDAHRSGDLGARFPECGEILRKAGFDRYVVYRDRKPEYKAL